MTDEEEGSIEIQAGLYLLDKPITITGRNLAMDLHGGEPKRHANETCVNHQRVEDLRALVDEMRRYVDKRGPHDYRLWVARLEKLLPSRPTPPQEPT